MLISRRKSEIIAVFSANLLTAEFPLCIMIAITAIFPL
nr:MAG TPA: hypothetical protein [Caudoviricetes sp.]